MTFQKKDLLNIDAAIKHLLEGEAKPKRLTYALVKNAKILETEVTAIREAYETESEGYKEYLEKLREIYNEYGAKDEQGNVKVTPTGFELAKEEDRETVTVKINSLEEESKEALDARNKEIEDYQELLNTEVALDLQKIEFDSLPETLNPEVMYVLDDLITEPK